MSEKKEIFLIPYAHLDTQWRWEYPTTIKKYIKSTLEDNIRLFEKYPEHRFNFTGAIRYQMMKEYYPELFNQMKKYVNENRWHIAGTCLDETDPLSPSVESLIRNILYGDRWAKNELGKSSRDYMVPDCFGFPGNFPTILSHCGIQGFSTQKLTWGSVVGIPFEIGIWNGPDNSQLMCAFNPGSYAAHLHKTIQSDNGRMEKLNRLGTKNGIWKSFQYYGVGDIGGAPTEGSVQQAIESIKQSEAENTGLIIRQCSPDEFFEEITSQEKKKMDHYTGDLLLTNHSAGTLTSASMMKRWNRKNEQLAFAAESAAVSAWIFAGLPYPDQKIRSAWYRIIGNQMHDILPGTSTPLAYEYSHNDEVVALNTWNTILIDSAKAISPYIKGNGEILLFNPSCEPRMDAIDINIFEWDEKNTSKALIKDSDGKGYPIQIRKKDSGQYQLTFIPELKPLSWSKFSLSQNETGKSPDIVNPVSITNLNDQYHLENATYKISITKDGKIYSIFHKKLAKEILKKPLAYEIQKERPMLYPSWNMDWNDRKKAPLLRIENGGKVSIIESGPLRSTIEITTRYKNSTIVKEISLSHDSKLVDFVERIHWRGSNCSLKLALNSNMEKPTATFNWETSRINRGINYEKLFEMPSRYWTDLSENNWGISIIEDSKYGYDRPCEDTLRMTLIYTPGLRYVTGFIDQKYHDWGDHTIRYGLYAHEGDFKTTDKIARAFNQKIRSFSIKGDPSSSKNTSFSLFQISNDQFGVLAIKKPEDTDGILIRIYERHGKSGNTDIIFPTVIEQVTEVNGLEEFLGEIPHNGNKFSLQLDANQIRSYIVKIKVNQIYNEIKQETISLQYNCKLIGKNGDIQAVFPKEITPSTIQAGAISFHLANGEDLNALQCQGQTIPISDSFNRLSILIGSKEECDTSFDWANQAGNIINKTRTQLSSIFGFRGLWDRRKWLFKPKHHLKYQRDYAWINKCVGVEPGFIKRDRIDWYATHIHKNGEDQPYQYGYMQTVTLDIPSDAKSLRLPSDNRIYIFALTAFKENIKIECTQSLVDKFDF